VHRTTRRRHLVLAVAAITLALAGAAPPLAAQWNPALVGSPASDSCLDRLPAGAFTRVPVYATVSSTDSTISPSAKRALLSGADVLLQMVAERARAQLAGGAPDSVLPHGDPALGDSLHLWRHVGGYLELTAFRDGRLTWRVPRLAHADPWATLVLARALASLSASNDAHVWWPSDSTGPLPDSIRFDFDLRWPSVARDGKMVPVSLQRAAQPLFSMLVPWEEPVRVAKYSKPTYPRRPLESGYRGTVLIVLVVDTAGRAEPESARDLWPPTARALNDTERRMYAAFVAASRDAALHTRFEPARIGGCPVRQYVQQPYEYDIAR
jgi:hypothetical protein